MSMTLEEAINRIKDHMVVHHIGEYPHIRLKEALDMSLTALRPVSRERVERVWRGEWQACFEDWRKQIAGDQCSKCGFQHYGTSINLYKFCPNCGAPMTDEAVQMVMERWKEALDENT